MLFVNDATTTTDVTKFKLEFGNVQISTIFDIWAL